METRRSNATNQRDKEKQREQWVKMKGHHLNWKKNPSTLWPIYSNMFMWVSCAESNRLLLTKWLICLKWKWRGPEWLLAGPCGCSIMNRTSSQLLSATTKDCGNSEGDTLSSECVCWTEADSQTINTPADVTWSFFWGWRRQFLLFLLYI